MKTNKHRRRLFSILLVAVSLFGVFPVTAHAWGTKGHQIIARIASQRLSSRARKSVGDLLRGQTLESVSMWAALERGKVHSPDVLVSIPLNTRRYESSYCKNNKCLIEMIKDSRSKLEDTKLPVSQRTIALKYLVHLIADLHQPFHCADNGDNHGQRISLKFSGKSTNLHQLWDVDMIEKVGLLTADEYVKQRLASRSVGQSSYNPSRGTIVDWALESNALGTSAHLSGPLVPNDAFNRIDVVDDQLYKAGVRLASILNDIFR